MRPYLALVALAATTAALWVAGYVWPVAGYVLIPFGAGSAAFWLLFLGEGAIQETRAFIRSRRYRRDLARARARFLAHREEVNGR